MLKNVITLLVTLSLTAFFSSCTKPSVEGPDDPPAQEVPGEDTGNPGDNPGEQPQPPVNERPAHRGKVVPTADGRFMMYENGEPFFWIGDTAWMLTDRMNLEEAREYLTKRAQQGWTVIMFSCLGDDYATHNANYMGKKAFLDADCTIFNDDYFNHVKTLIDIADDLGLVVGFLPNWGDKLYAMWGYERPVLHTKERAENYGRYIGNLLKDKENVIWVLGGDRSGEYTSTLVRAQAKGIAIGVSGSEDYTKCTMTYHPSGYQTSSTWFGSDVWVDFNMQQNGHGYDNVWERIERDYAKTPVKPVIDGEPTYDEHWLNFKKEDGLTSDVHCRRYFYHEVFSGAFGHTYGTTGIWSFYDPNVPFKYKKEDVPTSSWRESLELQSGKQMIYGKNLMMSRPYFTRIPDNSLVLNCYGGQEKITATRDKDRTYAMVYTERGKPINIKLDQIGKGDKVKAWWFNPRNGQATSLGEIDRVASYVFTPATNGYGNDWILVIDDPAAGYDEPGKSVCKENQ